MQYDAKNRYSEKTPRPYSDARTDKALVLILAAVVLIMLGGLGLAVLVGWNPQQTADTIAPHTTGAANLIPRR